MFYLLHKIFLFGNRRQKDAAFFHGFQSLMREVAHKKMLSVNGKHFSKEFSR